MVHTDPELKGEHFSKNNPDMMLDFEKPSYEEIQEMAAKKPTTSLKDIPGTTIPPFALDDGNGEIVDESGPMWNYHRLEEMKRNPPSEMDPEA